MSTTHRYRGNRKPQARNRSNLATGTVAGNTATIRINDVIDDWGGWWGISAAEIATLLDELPDNVDQINVMINSPGGVAFEGLAILNHLRNHPAKVTAYVEGLAASAASIIAVGVDETVMCPNAQMMIHDAAVIVYGQAADLRKEATVLDKLSDNIAAVYAAKAGGDATEWRAAMVEESWYLDDEAVDAGLADRVGTITTPAGDGVTAGDETLPWEDQFDLGMYAYAGRAQAPAPRFPRRANQARPQPPAASASGSTPPEGGETAVQFTDAQITDMRSQLGLAEDADEATIVAAIAEALDERADSQTPTIPEGMALVETTVLDELRANAEQGRQAREQQLAERRDNAITAAVADGRIMPARRDHWKALWDADADGAEQLLNQLPKGLVPLNEIGHADAPTDQSATPSSVREDDAYKNWSI